MQILSRSYASKLFIGGLAWGVDDGTLRTAFANYGEVTEARVIMDRETGRSRGFGFVTFENDNEAKAAVQGMDGHELGGRSIRVDYASDRPSAPRQDFGGGGFGGGGGGYGGGGGGFGGGGGAYGGGNEVM
ncbi:hypothetical protein SELMODRAFT_140819 [Selaginella moellendorffii]|uniref:RRM domain-containing protein n=2 Tax=Selaginella moellendorffii TaxID=88036 RepID=D8QSR9_SELML|nr:hypothetical protein SELMODRAFT_140819 [Selaginella moellendorffii]